MPIYYGCTRINEYFPPEAVVSIDINDPMAVERIKEIISSDLWSRNMDAIAHARELILDRYQLFPFLVKEIRDYERGADFQTTAPQPTSLSPERGNTLGTRLNQIARREAFKYGQRIGALMKQR